MTHDPRRPLPMPLVGFVLCALGLLGMMCALVRDPACAWVCAAGSAAILIIDIMGDR